MTSLGAGAVHRRSQKAVGDGDSGGVRHELLGDVVLVVVASDGALGDLATIAARDIL